jgi:hypothetical protein
MQSSSERLVDQHGLPLLSREERKKLAWVKRGSDINGSVQLRASHPVHGSLMNLRLVERVLGTPNKFYPSALGLRVLDASEV